MKELPNILCHNTLKKEMVDRFMIQAELTLKRFYDTSTAQIVDSHNLIVRDEPQENLNLRRNSNLPNRGNIDRYYTSEINHSIKGLSRILTLTLILPD